MATETRAGGEKARAAKGGAAPPGATSPQPDPAESGGGGPAVDDGPDEALFSPLWARLAIGAAVVTIVGALAQLLFYKGVTFDQAGNIKKMDPFLGIMIVVVIPFLGAAGCSVAADLHRSPRWPLALITGASTAATAFLTFALMSAITYFLAPFALVGGPLVRALMSRQPAGMRRIEHVMSWVFLGVFWPTALAVGGGFLGRLKLPGAIALAASATLIGAMITWTFAILDPDAAPEAPPGEAAPDTGKAGRGEERSGAAGS